MVYLTGKGSMILALAALLLFSGPGTFPLQALPPAASFEGGNLYRSGNVDILSLKGNYREMGRQYGGLAASRLRDFYSDITIMLVRDRGIPAEGLLHYAEDLFFKYPRRAREIILGMSETSGLTLNEHLVINAFEHYLFNREFTPEHGAGGCSAIAAWGPYTGRKELVFGRNYDFGTDVGMFKKYVNVAVFNPVGSGVSTAVVTFTGTLNATTEMNASGLFLELNNGGISAGGKVRHDRLSAPVSLFTMLLDFEDMARLDGAMQTMNTGAAFIINAADEKAAASYEWAPSGLQKIPPSREGLLVSTNHFIGRWKGSTPSDRFFMTVTRRNNLLALAKRFKGKIDPDAMKRILDTPLDRGGATSVTAGTIGRNPSPYTAYQVIALPGRKTLWLKLAGHQDWTEVNLSDYFR